MDNNKLRARRTGVSFDKSTLPLYLIIAAILIWAALYKPTRFYTRNNFIAMAYQLSEFGILSLGMMICMMSGGIDLSLVGIANLCAILVATVLSSGGSPVVAILVSLLAGAAAGAFNGFFIGYLRIPAMLVTLGGLQIFTGLGMVITKGTAVTGIPESFLVIGNGLVLNAVPISFIVFLCCVAVIALLLKYTVFGQRMCMMGSNAVASTYAGISNVMINLRTYMLSGILAGVTGVIMCSRYGSANADYGSSYTLLTLLIVVLGGVSPTGGRGRVFGVVLSIVILQLVSSAFNILRFSSFLKTCVWGLILMVVMMINYWFINHPRRSRASRGGAKP